jgi:hypothetical protein
VAAAMLVAVPSGASAAQQIGTTFEPDGACAAAQTRLQSVSPGGQYAAPVNGVITRWSFDASPIPPTFLRFKAARATGTADEFTVVGESALEEPVADEVQSFLTRIPVQAGDIIGFFNDSGVCTRADTGYTYHSFSGDVHPGDTELYSENADVRLDIAGFLELDCDNDGLGDETQDGNLLSCGPGVTPLTCKGQRLTIAGTNGPDNIVGTSARDVIAALAGNDNASGLGGNDLICGGSGKDKLKGGAGRDKLLGQKGKDKLKGGGAKDICKGGKGNDSAAKCEVEKSI